MKKLLGRRLILNTDLKTSDDEVLRDLSQSVDEDYGQEMESSAEEYEMHIPSILRTDEDLESIKVRGEGLTKNIKQEIISSNESSLPALPLAPLCKINFTSKNIQTPLNVKMNIDRVDITKPSSSDESSLLCNCSHDTTNIVASPALNSSIENNGINLCRISSPDYCSAKADRTRTKLEQVISRSCKERFCDSDCSAVSNRTDNHRKRKLIHSDENPDSCDFDGVEFQTKVDKEDHGINFAVNFFHCAICSATYDDAVSLARHMVIHSALTTFICDLWQKTLRRKVDLDRHNFVHSNVKPFGCERCSASFDRKSSLKKHMVCHSDVKAFTCEHCSMSFKRKRELQQHTMIHFDEKPFSCEHCNRSFKQKDHLWKHKVIHFDEKPFSCKHCTKTFKRKDALKRHVVGHSDQKPFCCEHCNLSFKRKSALKQHEVIHCEKKNPWPALPPNIKQKALPKIAHFDPFGGETFQL